MTPSEFADSIYAYCQTFNASVTSWGRTPKHNTAVGGIPESHHVRWLAADVVYDAPVPLEKRRLRAAQLGLFVWPENDHDHVRAA